MWAIQSEVRSVRYFLIPGFGNAYVVGDDGSLWSRYQHVGWDWVLSDDWTRLNPILNNDGYLKVTLRFNGKSYDNKMIHKLVYEAVYGPLPAGEEVCHNDGNNFNNDWRNLRHDTSMGNAADRIIHGTDGRGERNSNAKLNWAKVKEIRKKYATGKYAQTELALEYRVTGACISRIVNNLAWVE